MSVDGEVRLPTPAHLQDGKLPKQAGYVAGSRALDTLDKLITCTESFFHPSNSGPWTTLVRPAAEGVICQILITVHTAHDIRSLSGIALP